jgi:hypothetical protein
MLFHVVYGLFCKRLLLFHVIFGCFRCFSARPFRPFCNMSTSLKPARIFQAGSICLVPFRVIRAIRLSAIGSATAGGQISLFCWFPLSRFPAFRFGCGSAALCPFPPFVGFASIYRKWPWISLDSAGLTLTTPAGHLVPSVLYIPYVPSPIWPTLNPGLSAQSPKPKAQSPACPP